MQWQCVIQTAALHSQAWRKGIPFYQRSAPNALKYNKDDRQSAGDIYGVFEEIVVWITEFVKVYFTIILALLSELQKLIRVFHCRFVR